MSEDADRSADVTADRAIVKSSAIMSLGTLASRVTGYLRSILLVSAIGLQLHADLFTVANTIPNAIYILVAGGVLNAVLVPQLVRAMRNDVDGGDAYANRVVTLVGGFLVIISALLVLAAPLIIGLYAPPALDLPELEAQRQSLEAFARLCMPQVFFYGMFVLAGQILNARGRFGPMMFAPIANNVVACISIGLYLVMFGPASGTEPYTVGEQWLLGGGATLGVAAQALVLVPFLRGTGFRYRPRFDFRGAGLGHTGRLAVWTVLFVVVNQLAYLVIVRLAVSSSAASAAEGRGEGVGATVYQTASLIALAPHALITVSLATAALPRLARLAADGRVPRLRRDLVSTMRLGIAASAVCGVLLAVLAGPIATLLFGWGAAAGDTGTLATTIVLFTPGMLAFSIHFLALRGFYAVEDTRTPFFVQCVIAVVNVLAAVTIHAAIPAAGAVGLAASFSLAYVVGAVVSTAALAHRLGGLHRVELAWFLARAVAATIPAGLAALLVAAVSGRLVESVLGGRDGAVDDLAQVLAGGTAGAATYLVCARLLAISDVNEVVDLVRARLGRGRRTLAASVAALDPDPRHGDAHQADDPSGLSRHGAEKPTGPPSIAPTTAVGVDGAGRGPGWDGLDPQGYVDAALEQATDSYVADPTAEAVAAGFDTGPLTGLTDTEMNTEMNTEVNIEMAGRPVDPEGGGETVTSQAEPGTLFAERYRLEQLLGAGNGATTWLGTDGVLSRPVVLHLLPFDDPRVPDLARAARAAAALSDPHFLRLLDVSTDPADGGGEYAFVVREWVPGRNLAQALVDGPFDAEDATYVARELASAMTSAQRYGLAHLRLEPDTVVLADNGQVKVVDIAVDQVLRGTSADDATLVDTQGIGRVLYACLTGRWPDGPSQGLSAAPTQDGRLCSPRQVLAGVPGPLDEICDRILGTPPRSGRTPITTPAEVEEELTYAADRPRRRSVTMAAPPAAGATAAVGTAAYATDARAAPGSAAGEPEASPATSWRRPDTPPAPVAAPTERGPGRTFLGGLVAVILLAGALWLGYQLAKEAFGRNEEPASTPVITETTGGGAATTSPGGTPTPTAVALEIVTASSYDLESTGGNGEENEDLVPNAFDGDPTTSWTTVNYRDPMADQGKQGVGVVFDLGADREIEAVELDLLSGGGVLELRAAAPGTTAIPGELDGFSVAATVENVTDPLTITPEEPLTTRFLLVWFTELPSFEGTLKAGISEIVVTGR